MIHCKNCGYSFFGRTNQDFCCDKCRYQYNTKRVKVERSGINDVLKILIRNREILKEFFDGGSMEISKNDLSSKNYNFTYLTHQLKTPEGKNYIFCFEYGFSVSNDSLKLTKYDGIF